LVNAHYVKTVPGRKTDINDCQWLQQLHTYGLLSGSFRPDDQICVRSYIRQRDSLIKSASTHVQRMQKALIQMNLHLHKVISDITGVTGMAIIRAIVAGERNPLIYLIAKFLKPLSYKHYAKCFLKDFSEKDWLRLLRETKLLTPAEIALMVRKTAENAFYRNTQECFGEELRDKPLTVTVRDFLEVRSHFTPSMVREEDKIVEIRNKAVYARPAASPDTSRWAKEPEVLFGS
jgi:hypothetical protein